MSDSYNTRIKLKRDTEGNWTSKNPILLDGEMIIVKTNDGKIRKKIGDGVKKFSELPYDEIAIDSATSTTSTNPVQNKVITELLNEKIGSNKPIITEPEFLTKATLKSSNITVYADPGEYTGDKGENVPGITLHGGNSIYESTLVTIGGIFTPDYNLDGRDDMAVSIYYLNNRLNDKADNTVVDKDRNKAGLMSASDKIKLDGIAAGATKITIDSAMSESSTNPVQNKVIAAKLAGKAGTAVATESANGLMSAADKKKLDGIAAGANKTDVDSSLSGESIRPVQNRVVKTALDNKADKTALDTKMDKSGGTFTGNVNGKYFCGTWLQSTEASDLGHTPSKIAVLDDSGWVYYRTPAEILNDIGGTSKSYVDSAITQTINNAY